MSYHEYRQHTRKIAAFIYAPNDDKIVDGVKEGMLIGEQNLVRSQVDMYRTIIDLFGLESDYHYYGVNILSNEKTFALNTKTMSIYTDEHSIYGPSMIGPKNSRIIDYYVDEPTLDPDWLFRRIMDRKHLFNQVISKHDFLMLK